jgi:hypothetical protein
MLNWKHVCSSCMIDLLLMIRHAGFTIYRRFGMHALITDDSVFISYQLRMFVMRELSVTDDSACRIYHLQIIRHACVNYGWFGIHKLPVTDVRHARVTCCGWFGMREIPVTSDMTCIDYQLQIIRYSLVTIVWPVLHRLSAYDYLFDIFNLFLPVKNDSACMGYQLWSIQHILVVSYI